MFVIPCKYVKEYPAIQQIVKDIRKYHKTEKIVVVDSDSGDKSYFDDIKKYDVIIEDVYNKNYMVGAYWYVYKKYPNEEFYYFLHDSMRIKDNLDYMKEKDLTTLMAFPRSVNSSFDGFAAKINDETEYDYVFGEPIPNRGRNQSNDDLYNTKGLGIQGIIFFCKNKIMKKMLDMGADKILPNNKDECGYCEGCYGFFLEEQGYDLHECSMYGDVFDKPRNTYEDGPNHTNSERASKRFFPVEKYILSLSVSERN